MYLIVLYRIFCNVGIWWDLLIALSHNNTFSHKHIVIPLSRGSIRIFSDKFVGKDIDNNRKQLYNNLEVIFMKGSVRKKGATWSFRLDLGKQENGKRKQIERSGFKTEKEAQAMLAKYIDEYNTNGEVVENKRVTLNEVYQEFIDNEASNTRKYSTVVRYKSLYNNHIVEEIGYKYVGSFTPQNLQEYINRKNETLSDEFVRSLYNFLLVLFKYAVKRKYLRKSPTDDVIPPKSYRAYGEIKNYTKDELDKMEQRCSTTNLTPAFKIGINLGLRVGECFALRFSDIDWEKKTIRINKQLHFQDKQWSFIEPKTVCSVRTIKMGDEFTNYLKELQQQHKKHKQEYGDGYAINFVTDRRGNKPQRIIVDDFINVRVNGEMLTPNSIKSNKNYQR